MKKELDLLHGSLWDKILMIAIPIAASSILQQLFNAVDVAVVGKFAGTECLAAVGANSSLISLVINVFGGLSIGTNIVLSISLGQDDHDRASKIVHTAVTVSVICGTFMILIGQFFAKQILLLMATPESILPLGIVYLKIYFWGMPFIMVYNFVSAILRSKGDTRRPLVALMLAGVVNVILNLIFVVVFKMDVAGVALATVISNVISALLVIYFLMKEDGSIRLEISKLKIDGKTLVDMAKVGVPAGLQSAMFCFSNVCVQTAINSLGPIVMAATSASLNMEYMIYFIAFAFNQTAVTIVGQNYGANQMGRCYRTVRWVLVLSCVIEGIASVFVYIFARDLVAIFTLDAAVIAVAVSRLRYLMPYELLDVVIEVITGGLRGFGHSTEPAMVCVVGACVFRLVWIATVFKKTPTFGVLIQCYWLSWLVTAIGLFLVYLYVKKLQKQKMLFLTGTK